MSKRILRQIFLLICRFNIKLNIFFFFIGDAKSEVRVKIDPEMAEIKRRARIFLTLTCLIARPAFGSTPSGRGQCGILRHFVTLIVITCF